MKPRIIRLRPGESRMILFELLGGAMGTEECNENTMLGCYESPTNTIYLLPGANAHIFIHEMLHVVTTRFFHHYLPKLEFILDCLINVFFYPAH